jgi:uncharacterized membrane protein YdjX (TVP38/TMEM64 family)
MSKLKRFLPLLILLALLAIVLATGVHRHISFATLKAHRAELVALVAAYPILTLAAFIAFYVVFVAVSVPGAVFLTVAGGFLFGTVIGGGATVIGATAGATALFVFARSALGDALRRRATGFAAKMERGFRENAFNYLLVLRLVPAFPFFVVNLAAAVLGVPFMTYVVATALGIAPATFVFASFGSGLGQIFDRGEEPSLSGVLTPGIMFGLIGLALLALIPVAIKKLRRQA